MFSSFVRQLLGDNGTLFVALDVSAGVLAKLDQAGVGAIGSVLQGLQPFDADETRGLSQAIQAGDSSALASCITACFARRGGSRALGILPIVNPNRQMLSLLKGQPWVVGSKMTRKEMAEVYSYLLNGLDQFVRATRETAGADELWFQTTMTLGPVPIYGYDAAEPLNVATRRAAEAGVTIFVAAGNEGEIVAGNSLNPWSVAPWVIGVGASDAAGKLLASSSRGTADQPYKSPTIVAPGADVATLSGLDHEDEVAIQNIRNAPPGSVNTATTAKHTYLLRKDLEGRIWMSMISKGSAGQELPLEEVLELYKQQRQRNPRVVQGTSFAAEYVSGLCTHLVKRVKPMVPDLPKAERPKLVKALLEAMAVEIPGAKPWEAGKGLVTHAISEAFLKSVDRPFLDHLLIANE